MIEANYYKDKYETAEIRALYLVAKKAFGSLTGFAEHFGFSKSYFNTMIVEGVPEKYAGYLGRRYEFPAGLLCFDRYLQINKDMKYTELLQQTKFFNSEDKAYILGGSYIKDGAKFQRALDKGIRK